MSFSDEEFESRQQRKRVDQKILEAASAVFLAAVAPSDATFGALDVACERARRAAMAGKVEAKRPKRRSS